MCGIAGVYYYDRGREVTRAELTPMMEPLRPRGPDGELLRCGRGYGFVVARLAVIDPTPRAMPPYEARGHLVVFNGEIFNHPELRAELEREEGAQFATQTDGEVLPWLLARGGSRPLASVRGMYAIAAYESGAHRLSLLRDPAGEKPLVYASIPGGLVFGSTVAAVRAHPAVRAELDELSLVDHLAYGFVPGERTILTGVRRLEPGGVLEVRDGEHALRAGPGARPRRANPDLDGAMRAAVQERLRADRRVGIFLSGGIDSALTAAYAAELSSTAPLAFTARFASGGDEVEGARQSAAALGLELHEVDIDHGALDHLPVLTRLAGEPLGDASLLSLHTLARGARSRVVVVLGGDGADEWFHGYDRYRFLHATRWLRRGASCGAPGDPPEGHSPLARIRRGLGLLRGGAGAYPALLRRIGANSLGTLLRDPGVHARWLEREGVRAREYLELRRECRDDGEAAARWDRRHYLPYDPLHKTDLATMSAGLEARTPFLDPRVQSAGGGRAPGLLRRGKPLLRALARRRGLPAARTRDRKRGFRTPLAPWFSAVGGARELLAPTRAALAPWIAEDALDAWIGEHDAGVRDHSSRLYHLLSLAVYLDGFHS